MLICYLWFIPCQFICMLNGELYILQQKRYSVQRFDFHKEYVCRE